MDNPRIPFRELTPVSRDWGIDRGLPIDRYYIEKFLYHHRTEIRGRVLEVERDLYTTKFGESRVTSIDILDLSSRNCQASIVADLTCPEGVPTNVFDCIVCTQTLQFIYNARSAVSALHSMLRSGGTLLVTVPGITKVDRGGHDYTWQWSYTNVSARRLFVEVFGPQQIKVETYGNVMTSASFLYGFCTQELTMAELDYHDSEYEVIIGVSATK